MLERLGKDTLRAVLRDAHDEARAVGSSTVEAEHLLLALAADEHDPSGRLLAESGLDHDEVRAALEHETERSLAAVGVVLSDFTLPETPGAPRRRPKFAASAKRVVERAALIARGRRDRRITSSHLLLGILRTDIGTVPRALAAAGVDRDALALRAERLLA
jgi:D-alanyl-D-alanine carboxypeptidase